MLTESNYYLSPLKPYNDSMWDYFTLYDNMPYKWDTDNEKRIALFSGNIIKGYRCKINEPYEIKY